jgi:sialic acid synthase SpsE/quercetin dioxygenase-like cupin family protein
MAKSIPDDLFVFEIANNHMGDVNHGKRIIRDFSAVAKEFPDFTFAFKLQYRNLDTFIHPRCRGRDDVPYIKRFEETRLTRADFDALIAQMCASDVLTMATPFDERSVDMIEEQNLDLIKVASCSFNDWPLLERIVLADLPIIASTAGATLEDIDRVISFFKHRQKEFAIMHCVGEYPTPEERLHLNKIDLLKTRYPGVRIGFSTHEDPNNTDVVKIAMAKGAQIFERHVGVPTDEFALNAYSSTPQEIRDWLAAATFARTVNGKSDGCPPENSIEQASLRSLRRGVFANRDIAEGEVITSDTVFFAFPPEEGQITANEFSKYSNFIASKSISQQSAISLANAKYDDVRALVWDAAEAVQRLLSESQISVPGGVDLELSHHYGMDRFFEVGLTMITVVNREYCKKILVSLPNQLHPEQYHKQKEETFHVLYGDVELTLNGKTQTFSAGDVINIEPDVRHAFISKTGVVIEEISSTHYKEDSFYTDESINQNPNRKTLLTYWMG